MNKNIPLISVVISTRNPSIENLTRSIDSVFKQTVTNIEVILIDDGSDSHTAGKIDELVDRYNSIRLIRNHRSHGLAYALNKGIDVSKGRYIARMDDDDVSMPNRFEEQLTYLGKHPEIMFVGSNAMKFGVTDNDGVIVTKEFPQKKDFLIGSPFIHPSVMFRSIVFCNDIRYLSSKTTRRTEDYELFMRLESMGMSGANIQENLLKYSVSPESMARKRKYRYRIDEARVRYRGFKMLGIHGLSSLMIFKPLVVGLVPQRIIYHLHQRLGR